MTIRNIADRDQAAAAFRDVHADLETKRAELCAWIRLLAATLRATDRDLADIERTQAQLANMTFNEVVR